MIFTSIGNNRHRAMDIVSKIFKFYLKIPNISRLLDWSTKSIIVRLDKSHPKATFHLSLYEESIRSEFSSPLDIFR